MDPRRYLIVNADDFGQSVGVNRGIIEASERGIVTSASLMVRWPAAPEAAAYARAHPALSLGLHLDLGEWECRDEEWVAVYEVIPTDDARAVAGEVARQLAGFREMVGHEPTHLDSHQHVHRREPVRSALADAARRLGIPLRHFCPSVRYCGDFYGQTRTGEPYPEAIRWENLIEIIRCLPPGVTELACHPGLGDDLRTAYRSERTQEVATLCDLRVREALSAERVQLSSFHRLAGSIISA
jgi:predicted glycoside hydrolase/deacetylase ChbG (UPF0249 family)